MKKLLLILLCLPIVVLAQKTYVPDDIFEAYLEANGMGDGITLNDSVLTTNINTITYLNVDNLNINNLIGIEDFSLLTNLVCDDNQLTSIDISQNTYLEDLSCKENQLTSLDISQNTLLRYLDCHDNQLTNLDLTNNDSLYYLKCKGNSLTNLDLSNNLLLTTLECQYQQISSLNLSNNIQLTTLKAKQNQLNSIDLRNINLVTLSLKVYNNPSLFCIDVDDVSLATILFDNSDIDTWTSFDTNCITVLGCADSLALNYDSTATVNDGSCYYGKTYVPDDNLEAYLEANGLGDSIPNNDSVLTGSIDTVIFLIIPSQSIYDLTGIEDFTDLTELDCRGNYLTNLDVSQNNALIELHCRLNQLISLDVSSNTNLEILECSFNSIDSLFVGNNFLLKDLFCKNNQINYLDLSNNDSLTLLECQNNSLTQLNLRNTNISSLITINNPSLFCIDVDNTLDAQLMFPPGLAIDSWSSFDTNCIAVLGCMDSLSCNYDSTAIIGDNSCVYLPVTINNTEVTCSNFADATLEVNYNTGLYTFLWSNGETTQSIDSLPMGSYSVIVTDTAGCSTTLNASVNLALAPAFNMFPEICYITVDSTTGNNKLVVKPMGNPLTSKSIIYKESSANIYSPIDTINNILEYLDISSNPMIQSYRYKVSVLDTCGNESTKSSFHKTIHLTMSLGINGEINLLWNAYQGYQPTDYLIFRSINNGSMNQIGTLPGTNLAFTDLTPPSGNLNYQVRAIVPNCNIIPFAKQSTNMLASNVINYSATAVNELVNSKKVIKITDLLGRETKQTNQPLFYIYDDGTVEKRIVIE